MPRVQFLHILLLTGVPIMPFDAIAQLTVLEPLPIDSVVAAMLAGPGCTVSQVTLTPDTTHQFGVFRGENTCLELDSGIVLSTGLVSGAVGPNNNVASTTGVFNMGLSDADINDLFAPIVFFDEVILEFDVQVAGDSLTLDLCFGSDEYYPTLQSIYHDACGVFVSGPGIAGPFQNDAINMAVFPTTGDSIFTHSVNPLLGLNLDYYQYNGFGTQAPYNADPYYVQYDGLTRKVHCAVATQAGATYHVKIVLADGDDWGLDAGLFLGAHSLSSPLATGLRAHDRRRLWVTRLEGELNIAGLAPGWHSFDLLSLDGRLLASLEALTGVDTRMDLPRLAHGLYVLRVDHRDGIRFFMD